jgi:hypothetical protein
MVAYPCPAESAQSRRERGSSLSPRRRA